jgi:hypothetical protein
MSDAEPDAAPDPSDDEEEERTSEDVREQAADELGEAHAAAVAYVRFPREDNDLSEVDSVAAMFILDDEELSPTEEIAARSLIEDGTEEIAGRAEQGDDGNAVAMPAPPGLAEALGGMFGGGGDGGEQNGDDRRGFQ